METLNADIPHYAHIPVITTEEKKKISKRNNEYLIRNLRYFFWISFLIRYIYYCIIYNCLYIYMLICSYTFREEGFKPECVVNYMTTLGWGSISKKYEYS